MVPTGSVVRPAVGRTTRLPGGRHSDGFLYPPASKLEDEEGRPVPNSERPAHLFHVPASHELRLDQDQPPEDPHRPHASFLMHLIAYLHGTWFQFEDRWFDARVPIERQHNIHLDRVTGEHFLSYAYGKWQTWGPGTEKQFTNILFMLNRAPSYRWDWEHFIIEYTVLDACYKVATEDLQLLAKVAGHAKRIDGLCAAFNIPNNPGLVREIVDLRNNFFHEALWDGGQPGAPGSPGAFYSPLYLRQLNQRLVLALLGYDNKYMHSGWWSLGCSVFDKIS